MNVSLVIRYLNSLWKFILDNPEISIFIAGVVGTGTMWLFRANPLVLYWTVLTLVVLAIGGIGTTWLFRACFRWWRKRNDTPPINPPVILSPPSSLILLPPLTPPPSLINEVWFVNVGEHQGHLIWEDCIQYDCIGAGGGVKYRDALQKLSPGDTVYAYITGEGYVGYGRVIEEAKPIKDFIIGSSSLLKNKIRTKGLERDSNNLELSEYIVRMDWLKTYPRDRARWRSDLFFYRGTLCRLTEAETLKFLRAEFKTKAGDKARCYSTLDHYLGKEEWKAANEETYQLLIAEFGKEGEGWLELEELMSFPSKPLKMIDELWVKHSEGKFGFSVQKEIYIACGGIPDSYHHWEVWKKFCDDVDWEVDGKEISPEYSNAASPRGHLPLHSRGTSLDVTLGAWKFPHTNITSHNRSQCLGTVTEILFSRLEPDEL